MLNDMVNSPVHYKREVEPTVLSVRDALISEMGMDVVNLECFEAMASMLTIEEMRGYLRGNSFKYRWRYTEKNGVQDLEKAQWYDKKLLVLENAIIDYDYKELDNVIG